MREDNDRNSLHSDGDDEIDERKVQEILAKARIEDVVAPPSSSIKMTTASVKKAADLWHAYLDGERDMRTAYTMWDSISESMQNYRLYYEYRIWGANPAANTGSKRGSSNQATVTSDKNLADTGASSKASSKKIPSSSGKAGGSIQRGNDSSKKVTSSSSSTKGQQAIKGNEEVTKLLYEMCKDPEMSSFLLLQAVEHGADLNWMSPEGDSYIHLLAATHAYDTLACLLSIPRGVKSSQLNKQGQTALIIAARKYLTQTSYTKAQRKTIKLLLEQRDVKINQIDTEGFTALYYAWKAEDIWLICKLLRRQASVLSTLSLYAKSIYLLFELDRILSQSRDPQIQIRHIKERKDLLMFLSSTEVAPIMIDYNTSTSTLLLKTLSQTKQEILTGLLLFRVRDELRYLKSSDPPKIPEVTEVLAKEKPIETEHRYEKDLEIRDKFRTEHKLSVKQQVTYKKEKELYREWDQKREKHLAQLDKEYNTKITGLYV